MLCAAGCRSREPDRFDWLLAHYDAGALSPSITIGDPATAKQQLWGFYPEQEHRWAWTEPEFAVALAPPRPVLRMRFFVSPQMIEQLGEVSVRATVNGVALAPERYVEPGDHQYTRDLGGRLLDGPMRVELSVSPPYLAPRPDTRRLGVIVKSIAVEGR